MNPSTQLRPAADAVTALVAAVTADQMGNPTPCAEWNVRGLLNHLVGAGHLFAGAFAGDAPTGGHGEAPEDLVGDDPRGAWQEVVDSLGAAIDTPGALERLIPLPFGPTPGAVVLEILKFDVLVHAWDLARATGQHFDPPAELVEPALAFARQIIAPEMRNGSVFAAEAEAPAGSTPIERLVAFTGRTV